MMDNFKYWNIHRDNNIQLPVMDLETKNLFKPVMNMSLITKQNLAKIGRI